MTPTGGLGPPPPFFHVWKHQSVSFLRQLETNCLLYQLRLRAILQYMMMHKWHCNSSWKTLSWHWFEDDNGNLKNEK